MPVFASYEIFVFLLISLTLALPSFFTLTPYAPTSAQCPSTPIVRKASDLCADEAWYRTHRSAAATQSLLEWFALFNSGLPLNDSFPLVNIPVVALASSGGGVRSLLSGAGVVQAFDNRDPSPDALFSSLKGLYQGFIYHSGVESGSWLLAALGGNDAATISNFVNDVWISSFATDDFLPVNARGPATYSTIGMDLVARALSGYPPTLVDTWGRLLSQQFLQGEDGGVKKTLSGIVNDTGFSTYSMPYPILTALAINPTVPGGATGCISTNPTSPQYEFHPFEYGSWDRGVRTFARTEFMASPSSKGMALARSTCVHGFDNIGMLIAASGNEFNYWCSEVPPEGLLTGPLGLFKQSMIEMTNVVHGLSFLDEYAIIPNSDFVDTSTDESSSNNLYLVSGASAGENIPLWPLIQPERKVDVIIANDNSQDTSDYLPNGTSLYSTYFRARRMGLTTMPLIPSPEVFIERGYNRQPVFFGCYNHNKTSIVYLPNSVYTFNSNIPDWILQYSSDNVTGMIANGNQVATYGGNEVYKKCLGCFLLSKVNAGKGLPTFCGTCMDQFCYRS